MGHINVIRRINIDHRARGEPLIRDEWRFHVSDEKINVVLSVVEAMAAYYPHPDCFDAWSRGLLWRENLGSTAFGYHFGFVHQFQGQLRSVPTTSKHVDWWLFLFPEGVEYDSFDDQPVHALYGLVLFDPNPIHYENRTLGLVSNWCRHTAINWRAISSLGATDAAHLLNRELGRYLLHCDATGRHSVTGSAGP